VANRIEHNHIHHINADALLSDNGGIYTLGRQPGATLRGNVIHDVGCYGYGGWGIYPDEGTSGMRIEHNLVYGTRRASFSIHYGRDNLVQHNVFAFGQADHVCLGKREPHRTTVFRRNVVLSANGHVRQRGDCPAHNTMADNLYWPLDGTPLTFDGETPAALRARGQDSGAVLADPLFADAAGGDFSLRSDSPVSAIGFRPFDWRSAGPRFAAERPASYADYAAAFELPPTDGPVVDIRIDPVAAPEPEKAAGRAAFAITLTNVGRLTGHGCLRLTSGPEGLTDPPSLAELRFDLAPGEQRVETVFVKVARGTEAFWLDSEPADDLTVPARGLVLAPGVAVWRVPLIEDACAPEGLGKVLERTPTRTIRHGPRTVADISLGAAARQALAGGSPCLILR
jgi:hypothetical protein